MIFSETWHASESHQAAHLGLQLVQVKVTDQGRRSNLRKTYIAYNFAAVKDTDHVFDMCTHFMELEILGRVWLRSRSYIKVKGQI